MEMNWLAILVAALIPMIMGFIWYNPKVMGTAWMKATGLTEESMKSANMAVIFGVSFLFSLMLALSLLPVVIHQMHVASTLMSEPGFGDTNSDIGKFLADFMAKYGNNFRTFKHGALHGALCGIFLVLPILGTNALFERKGGRYIMINASYWIITLALMGGVICAWQ